MATSEPGGYYAAPYRPYAPDRVMASFRKTFLLPTATATTVHPTPLESRKRVADVSFMASSLSL